MHKHQLAILWLTVILISDCGQTRDGTGAEKTTNSASAFSMVEIVQFPVLSSRSGEYRPEHKLIGVCLVSRNFWSLNIAKDGSAQLTFGEVDSCVLAPATFNFQKIVLELQSVDLKSVESGSYGFAFEYADEDSATTSYKVDQKLLASLFAKARLMLPNGSEVGKRWDREMGS